MSIRRSPRSPFASIRRSAASIFSRALGRRKVLSASTDLMIRGYGRWITVHDEMWSLSSESSTLAVILLSASAPACYHRIKSHVDHNRQADRRAGGQCAAPRWRPTRLLTPSRVAIAWPRRIVNC